MSARRGSALILVLLMTLAVAGLAIAAIFMSSSAGLLSRFYDREREFRLAAESGLELAIARLARDSSLAVPDTGMIQLTAGFQVTDAAGNLLPRARVNVFASQTGDTTGLLLPFVTLLSVSYDANGTRHVRRADLRRESFSRYALFVDSFPTTVTHGPGTVSGRVHSNQDWRGSASGNRYRDTVSTVAAISGTGTFDVDSVVGVTRIPYPSDSTFAGLAARAAAADLSFTPVSGSGRGTRLEFVAFDADGDGVLEAHEGFAKVFDLASAAGIDTTRLRASPAVSTGYSTAAGSWLAYYRWDDPIIQNQCGAFYYRDSRWSFFPVSIHRSAWARSVIQRNGSNDEPNVNNGMMNRLDDYSYEAAAEILSDIPTARCFPAGSPYLMPAERFTNVAGAVTGNPATDTVPFGVVTPSGGWPASASGGYGGTDSTFTDTVRTCTISAASTPAGRCVAGSRAELGIWRAFGGTPVASVAGTVRQERERRFLWPVAAPANPASRGVINSTAGPLYVSGVVRGNVTLLVGGRAAMVDRLTLARDPNDPEVPACDNGLGVVARGDILVVDGLTSRVRRVGRHDVTHTWLLDASETVLVGGSSRFTLHGAFMSLAGTFGTENAGATMGDAGAQFSCPTGAASSTASNGGCLALTGSAVMRRYSPLYTSTANSGFRYEGAVDRCQSRGARAPFFPLTNRLTLVRTLEIEPSQANTPAKIRAILMRLKGRAL